jgi:hypothetical protein
VQWCDLPTEFHNRPQLSEVFVTNLSNYRCRHVGIIDDRKLKQTKEEVACSDKNFLPCFMSVS